MRKLRLSGTELKMKLQLSVFSLLVQVSLGVIQRMTVMQGQPVFLKCPVTIGDVVNREWMNPEHFIMFFNENKGLNDKRFKIETFSPSEFSISISRATFKDGGNYTCSQYGNKTFAKKTVELTVLGLPRMSVAKDEGNVIKCTAEGNHYPPQISWKFNNGPEFLAPPHFYHENKKYVSTGLLRVLPVTNRVTVKCLVRHTPWGSRPLVNFVKIGPKPTKLPPTVTTRTPTELPASTTSGWFRDSRTAVYFTTSGVNTSTSNGSTPNPEQPLSSRQPVATSSPETSSSSQLSTEGGTFTSETTVDFTFNETTKRNITEGSGQNTQRHTARNSSLLIILVTSLIFGLLVVVIFFTIKLRRAHIAWKRENEDSDPSEESSKSKSVQEDKNSQGQRRRGLFNIAFTQYVVEEPTGITSVHNPNAVTPKEGATKEKISTSQPEQSPAKSNVKETSL